MPAKIRLEVDNATRPGFNETSADLQKLADKLGITQDAAKGLKREMDNRAYAEYRKELRRQADELDGTAQKMREAAAEAKRLADAQREAAEEVRQQAKAASESQRSVGESIRAVVDVWQLAKDAARLAGQAIVAAAESGNESAKSMVREFTLAKEALVRVGAESRTLKNLFGEGSAAIDGWGARVGAAAKQVDSIFAQSQKGLELLALDAASRLGIIQRDQFEAVLAAEKRRFEGQDNAEVANREAAAVAKAEEQIGEARKRFDDEERRAAEERKVLNLDDKTIQAEIVLEISKREKMIQNIAVLDRLTAEEKQKEFEKEKERLGELLELLKKRQHAEKDAAEAKIAAAKEAAAKAVEAAKQQHQQELDWQLRYMEESERQRKQFEAAKKQAEAAALQKVGAGNLQSALGQLDPRKVREQYARGEVEQFLGGDEAAAMSQRERAQRAQQIRRGAFRDFNSGRADQAEVVQAQGEVLGKSLDQARQSGKTSAQAVQTIGQAVNGLAAVTDAQQEQEQQLKQLQEAMGQIMNRQGRRGRDQKFGNR